MDKVSIISLAGMRITAGGFAAVTDLILTRIHQRRATVVLPCSLNDLAAIDRDAAHRNAYATVDIATTDGMPLVWWCRLRGITAQRVYGPDLMMELLRRTERKGYVQVFFGSSPSALTRLEALLARKYPALTRTTFIAPPYFRMTDTDLLSAFRKRMRRLQPRVLWLGISSPKQVALAAYLKRALPETTICCVGAAFDLTVGMKPKAPAWMQRSGMEWLFRLGTDPRRLARRYLIDIPRFLLRQLGVLR